MLQRLPIPSLNQTKSHCAKNVQNKHLIEMQDEQKLIWHRKSIHLFGQMVREHCLQTVLSKISEWFTEHHKYTQCSVFFYRICCMRHSIFATHKIHCFQWIVLSEFGISLFHKKIQELYRCICCLPTDNNKCIN